MLCHGNLENGPSIVCYLYLDWVHQACAGLKNRPKAKNWFCRECKSACSVPLEQDVETEVKRKRLT